MICIWCGRCDDDYQAMLGRKGRYCSECRVQRRADRAEATIWGLCGGALLLLAVEVSRVLMGWSW